MTSMRGRARERRGERLEKEGKKGRQMEDNKCDSNMKDDKGQLQGLGEIEKTAKN